MDGEDLHPARTRSILVSTASPPVQEVGGHVARLKRCAGGRRDQASSLARYPTSRALTTFNYVADDEENRRCASFLTPDVTVPVPGVVDALRSGWITTGPRTGNQEKRVAPPLALQNRPGCLPRTPATASLGLTAPVAGVVPGTGSLSALHLRPQLRSVHVERHPVIVDAEYADSSLAGPRVLESSSPLADQAVIPVDVGGRINVRPARGVNSYNHLFTPAVVKGTEPRRPCRWRRLASVPGARRHASGSAARASPPSLPP